jgi:hypothetical protein
MSSRSSPGAFVIQEDIPGRRLALTWQGPQPSPLGGWEELVFDGAGRRVEGTRRALLPGRTRRLRISYDAIESISIEVCLPWRPKQRRYYPTLTLQYRAGARSRTLRLPFWVRGFQRHEPAKELLFRIAWTTALPGEGAFRSSGALGLGWYRRGTIPDDIFQVELLPAPKAGLSPVPSPRDHLEAAAQRDVAPREEQERPEDPLLAFRRELQTEEAPPARRGIAFWAPRALALVVAALLAPDFPLQLLAVAAFFELIGSAGYQAVPGEERIRATPAGRPLLPGAAPRQRRDRADPGAEARAGPAVLGTLWGAGAQAHGPEVLEIALLPWTYGLGLER